jgi:penicillin-binding protein 1A
LTLRQALVESNNRAAVALQQRIGARPILRLASSAGLRNQPDVPSLALGSGLVTPLELAGAYAAFPNGGFRVTPRAIRRVIDEDGDVVLDEPSDPERILPAPIAFQMVSMMRDVIDRGTGAGVRAAGVRFPVAGKTGTTNDFKDAWFVGYSTTVVAAVWVGYDQPAPIGKEAFGSRIALPIWTDFMRRTARTLKPREFTIPDGLQEQELCRISYLRPVESCPVYTEYFKDGDTIPRQLCTIHHGNLKQRAQRAIQGFFSGMMQRLRDILK